MKLGNGNEILNVIEKNPNFQFSIFFFQLGIICSFFCFMIWHLQRSILSKMAYLYFNVGLPIFAYHYLGVCWLYIRLRANYIVK